MMALVAAPLLFAATVAAWFVASGARAAARVQLRFAAALFATCAIVVAALPVAAPAVVLLVLPIAVAVLALAALAGFERALAPAPAAALLALASLCGIASAMTGLAMFALGASVLGSVGLLLVCLRQFDSMRLASVQGALAALCLLAAQSVFVLDRAGAAFLLFVSAGLLGVTLALSRSDVATEKTAAGDLRVSPIRGRRAV